MKKQAAERDDDPMDRISQLPQPILHNILSFLSQNDAVQTCVLSKSWRYLGSTRPKFEFRESYFAGNNETFLFVLDKTLRRYHDQKLSILEFLLEMSKVDSESISFLEKWIPIVILKMGVKKFHLSVPSTKSAYFDLQSVFVESESLEDLYLDNCKLDPKPMDRLLFKHLKRLSLKRVYIGDETLGKILSSCPLIEYVILHSCEGLRTIKVTKAHNLKHFDLRLSYMIDDVRSIEIDVPTLETIKIEDCPNWFHHHNNFPHLKSLDLHHVRLSGESFDRFSRNFPCLEELNISFCNGFEEFQLSSPSIKHLTILGMYKSVKVVIDAPSLMEFEYHGDIPQSISFTTTSSEWKSYIMVWSDANFDYDASSWYLKLHGLLKALSQSEIYLDIFQHLTGNEEIENPSLVVIDTYGGFYEPIAVKHLHLRLTGHSSSSSSAFIKNLFHICRPTNRREFMYDDP